MDYIYKLEDMVCKELKDLARGEINNSNLDTIDKLVHTLKGIVTIEAMMEKEDSYGSMSGRRGYSRESRGYSERDSYRGSYEGDGYSGRRDSMGRYSRDSEDEMMDRIKMKMANASSDKERDIYSQMLKELEELHR